MTDRYAQSQSAHELARVRMPGGVNSPVRALGSVGGVPFFAASGKGAWITDVDGNRYVDYIGSFGPLVLGHAHPAVVAAVTEAVALGTSFGAPTEAETELADLVAELVPSMERMRLVSSGTEATMSAIRLARGVTGRDKIIKFNGCYHGHADYLLVKAGSGALTFGQPDSAGVPAGSAKDTLVADYNDPESVSKLLRANVGEVAAIIVEPVPGNMGVIPPQDGFLEALRTLCDQHGTLLIFDEVMSGFRVHLGGAQALYNVKPDLTCLGKVIGGGLPVGAYGGRADLLAHIAPEGAVYQAGTLSGNPLSVAGGLATLRQVSQPGEFERAVEATTRLCNGLRTAAQGADLPLCIQSVGTMFTAFFVRSGVTEVRRLADVQACDFDRFKRFFHGMRDHGVSLPPSQYEACFVSSAHDDEAIDATLGAAEQVFATL
ncbi:MAG: glutamate-1-semialdehyde 2,1-aminomutase [Myxococcota bacterium]|jgi:glutamate-1-semialdehyde 2,1-aminomutase